MKVGREETIAGVRLMRVRDFLRWTGDSSVQLDAIAERFGCDYAKAQQIEKPSLMLGSSRTTRTSQSPASGTS